MRAFAIYNVCRLAGATPVKSHKSNEKIAIIIADVDAFFMFHALFHCTQSNEGDDYIKSLTSA